MRVRIDHTDTGDQAVLQCANHGGQYCCDHNRDVNNVCCDQTDSQLFFALDQGKSYASIPPNGNAVAVSGASPPSSSIQYISATQTGGLAAANAYVPSISNPVSSILASVSDANAIASIPSPTSTSSTPLSTSSKTTTIVQSSTQSGQNGQTSVVLLTSVITTGAAAPQVTSPSAATDTTSPPHKSSNAAAIGGGVGGGVAALLLLSALAFFLLRRSRRRRDRELDEATMHRPQGYLADQKNMEYMYKGQDGSGGTPYTGTTIAAGAGDSPELDSTEVRRKPSGKDYRPGDVTRLETKVRNTGGNGLGLGQQSHTNENRLSELAGSSPTTAHERTYPAQGKWERYEQAGQSRS
ncbi:MAG: hypothetical protein LQ352_007470 [Teloschistes flavicans]|nr:MAG: hypothetical protein LQ352_007470 [Teloschistes flavicans]